MKQKDILKGGRSFKKRRIQEGFYLYNSHQKNKYFLQELFLIRFYFIQKKGSNH